MECLIFESAAFDCFRFLSYSREDGKSISPKVNTAISREAPPTPKGLNHRIPGCNSGTPRAGSRNYIIDKIVKLYKIRKALSN